MSIFSRYSKGVLFYERENVVQENRGVLQLRSAGPSDAALVLGFIKKLAHYQGLSDEVCVTEDILRFQLSEEARPQIWVILAEFNGVTVGMAVYYLVYSTFRGKWGIHLEDLFIEEGRRSEGIGRAFFVTLAKIAHKHGYDRIELSVQASNVRAQHLYDTVVGAKRVGGWVPMRIDGEQLKLLATRPDLYGVCRPN